jgi:presenilin-like A22 family membrane protease
MTDRSRILLHSAVLFGMTAVVSLSATWWHIVDPSLPGVVGPLELTLTNALILIGVFVVFTLLMVRFIRVAHASLPFFLVVALLAGTQFILSPWIPSPWDMIAAVGMAIFVWRVPRVLVHDLAIMFGIGGIAGVLGLSMTPLVACGLLALLSVYDIVSVYRTRHMVTLAGRMLESGAVFGFLIPARTSGFLARRQDALSARSVMMLGSGDIGLPLILAASAVSQSLNAAALVAVGALAGVMGMHWLFAHQERSMPMAALPPIAMSAILGYAVAIALGI